MRTIPAACLNALAATALVAACAPPALGASSGRVDQYTAVFDGGLQHDRSGVDDSIAGIHWERTTHLWGQVRSSSTKLEFHSADRTVTESAPMRVEQVSNTDVEDTIAMTVDEGLQTTSCVNDGQGTAGPGTIRFSAGAPGKLQAIVTPFSDFTVKAFCSGFSNATGSFTWGGGAPAAKRSIPWASIGRDRIATAINGTVPCPPDLGTDKPTSCRSAWSGTLDLELAGSYEAVIDDKLKRARVKAPGASGAISAYAVARDRQKRGLVKPRKVGTGKLSGGTGVVALSPGGRETIKKRGAVQLRIKGAPAIVVITGRKK